MIGMDNQRDKQEQYPRAELSEANNLLARDKRIEEIRANRFDDDVEFLLAELKKQVERNDLHRKKNISLQSEVSQLREEIDRLHQEIRSHAPEGRNYTNQQYVELQELHENQLTINVALMKRVEDERAAVSQLKEERDEFKHGHIMLQKELKAMTEDRDDLEKRLEKIERRGYV